MAKEKKKQNGSSDNAIINSICSEWWATISGAERRARGSSANITLEASCAGLTQNEKKRAYRKFEKILSEGDLKTGGVILKKLPDDNSELIDKISLSAPTADLLKEAMRALEQSSIAVPKLSPAATPVLTDANLQNGDSAKPSHALQSRIKNELRVLGECLTVLKDWKSNIQTKKLLEATVTEKNEDIILRSLPQVTVTAMDLRTFKDDAMEELKTLFGTTRCASFLPQKDRKYYGVSVNQYNSPQLSVPGSDHSRAIIIDSINHMKERTIARYTGLMDRVKEYGIPMPPAIINDIEASILALNLNTEDPEKNNGFAETPRNVVTRPPMQTLGSELSRKEKAQPGQNLLLDAYFVINAMCTTVVNFGARSSDKNSARITHGYPKQASVKEMVDYLSGVYAEATKDMKFQERIPPYRVHSMMVEEAQTLLGIDAPNQPALKATLENMRGLIAKELERQGITLHAKSHDDRLARGDRPR